MNLKWLTLYVVFIGLLSLSSTAPAEPEFIYFNKYLEVFDSNDYFLYNQIPQRVDAELRIKYSDKFSTRYVLHRFPDFFDDVNDDLKITADMDDMGAGFMFDWHPFGNAFRATAGFIVFDHEIDANVVSLDNVNVNGQNIAGKDALRADAEVKFFGVSPYLGFGVGKTTKGKYPVTYSLDIGVIIRDSPDVDFDFHGMAVDQRRAVDPARVAAQEKREARDLKDDLAGDVIPVITFGITVRF